jgi:hypothetical protein
MLLPLVRYKFIIVSELYTASKTSISFYQTTWFSIPEYRNLHTRRLENLLFYRGLFLVRSFFILVTSDVNFNVFDMLRYWTVPSVMLIFDSQSVGCKQPSNCATIAFLWTPNMKQLLRIQKICLIAVVVVGGGGVIKDIYENIFNIFNRIYLPHHMNYDCQY